MFDSTLAFAAAAGVLSTLSPCVLPLLPIVVGSAAGAHRHGPLGLAAGLAVSFVAIGMFVATLGQAIGIDQSSLRTLGGAILLVLGVVLAVPVLSEKFATAAAPVSGWAEQSFGGFDTSGLSGQFALGLLLGAVWSPCVGPTLGAASVLAAQGENLGQVALTMAAFGLGAALPLVLLGQLSRDAMLRWRGKLMSAGKGGKMALGILLAIVGFAVLTGLDKRVEAVIVEMSPQWLTDLTTRF
ncbi:MAG: cytochrome c biogenesis CcdA family protein [Hyphomicrobium sp.]